PLHELRALKLPLDLPHLLLQLLALARDARTLLLEVNQAFERHGDLRSAREHCTRRRARDRLAAESHVGINFLCGRITRRRVTLSHAELSERLRAVTEMIADENLRGARQPRDLLDAVGEDIAHLPVRRADEDARQVLARLHVKFGANVAHAR